MPSTTTLDVRRVAGHIGAEIRGIDISHPLGPSTVAEIRQALLAHKVVFFRGQTLDHAAQIRRGARRRLTAPPPRAGA
jgi:alpha-ketoglutarate-dependent sulfate ester dioxygenase